MPGGRVVTRKGRWVLGGVGAFFVAGLAWVVLRALPANVAATPEAVPTVRPGVVVLGLRPEAGGPEAAWLSAALTEGLGTTIAAHPKVRLVSPDVASRMQTELGLTSADTLDPDALGRIRLNTGADLVVAGAVQPALAGGRIRLSLDVFDARTGARHAAVADSAPAVELFDLTFRAGRALGAALDFGAWPADAEGAIQAALPAGLEAAQRYAEGLSRLRVLDARGAVASFERLLELQPDFALAQGALARAWSIMGYEPRAKAAAVRALAASEGLSRENRLLLEALHHDTHRDWNQAIEVYRVLFGFFPDQVDYGLRLLDAQASGDEAGAAQQTLERLRRLPPPASQDARIDLAEGRIAEAMSDFERERTAAARARLKASTQGASILLADAWYYEGWALWNLGKPAEAMAAYREAHTLFESAGLRVRAADMINAMGILQWDEGKYEDALRLLDEALTIKREAGQLANVANILNNISNVHKSRGELTTARRYMEEAIAVREETGQEGPLSANLANLANLMRDMGDLDGAKTQYLSSIVIARRVGRRHTEANALMNLAELYHTVGELAEARRAHESAIALSRAVDRPRDVAFSYWGLGRLAFSESDLDRAIALYDSSVAEYRRIEYDVEAEENRLWIVEVHLAAGRYPEAEALLEEVVPYLQRQEDTYGELFAQALRLRLYLAREDRRAGGSAAERIRVLREDNEDFELDALAAIELARFEAAEGRAAEALATLEDVAEETGRRRYVSTHLEARLAMAELERGLGRTAAAERRRAAVEAEARAYGFVGLADRARRGQTES
jgi:tetratricopeptide (TPR) repeat protein